jgi:uncharacterized protein YecE (DUF72 family)
MRVFVGTSGDSYKEWKGPFYPKEVPSAGSLRYHATHFGTVEINNTFYRMPTSKLVEGWASGATRIPRRSSTSGRERSATSPGNAHTSA